MMPRHLLPHSGITSLQRVPRRRLPSRRREDFRRCLCLSFVSTDKDGDPTGSGEPRGPCSSLHHLGKPDPHRFAKEQGKNTFYLDGWSPSRWPWNPLQRERQRLTQGSRWPLLYPGAPPRAPPEEVQAPAQHGPKATLWDPQRSSKKSKVHSQEELLRQIVEK